MTDRTKRTDIYNLKIVAERITGVTVSGEPIQNAYQKLNYLFKGYPELATADVIQATINELEVNHKETIKSLKLALKAIK